jgi:hypothetical protein
MAKTFKFDAIGRDLYPGERLAAQEFTRKYQSPPTQAVTHREMAQVASRVLKAAAHISTSASFKASATVTRGTKVQGSMKSLAGSALTAKAAKRSIKG